MKEVTFFEYEDVKVTNTRFINGSQTYAMNNITSVKTYEQKPNRNLGILICIIGLGITITGQEPIIGILIMAAAIIFMYLQKTIFHVMLATSGGETSALKTHQREYLNKVISAVNQAIVHRG